MNINTVNKKIVILGNIMSGHQQRIYINTVNKLIYYIAALMLVKYGTI